MAYWNRNSMEPATQGEGRGLWLNLLALLPVLLLVGCSASKCLARHILRAPNTYPTWLEPKPRVLIDYPARLTAHLPALHVEVGPPPARLHLNVVEPGNYGYSMDWSNRVGYRNPRVILTLHGKVPPSAQTRQTAVKTLILLHGYGVDEITMLPWALCLAEQGYRCVLVDLRGHGDSTGKRIYLGIVETKDLKQVLDLLVARGLARPPVGVMGESYGAALALRWAAQDPRVGTVVALAPYAALEPAIMGLRSEFVRWLPRRWVRHAAERLPAMLGVPANELNTTPYVKRLHVPALFIAAGHDPIAPPSTVHWLSQQMPAPSSFRLVPDATHETLPFCLRQLEQPVTSWFALHLE